MSRRVLAGFLIAIAAVALVALVAVFVFGRNLPGPTEQVGPAAGGTIVTLSGPPDGHMLIEGQVVPVSAEALAPGTITALELWIDGSLYASSAAPSGVTSYGSFWPWPPAGVGEHQLFARALTFDGAAVSNVVRVQVEAQPADQPPNEPVMVAGALATGAPAAGGGASGGSVQPGTPQPVSDWGGLAKWLFALGSLLPKPDPPPPPVLSIAADGCSVQVMLHDQAANESGFIIYRSDELGGNFEPVATLASLPGSGGALSWVDEDVYGSLVYYAAAFNLGGQAQSNPAGVFVLDPACLTISWGALQLINIKLIPQQAMEKIYCYVAREESGPWLRFPADPGVFLNGNPLADTANPDLLPELTDLFGQGIPPGGLDLQLDCWGWQGGALGQLGAGALHLDGSVVGHVASQLPGFEFDADVEMKPMNGPGMPDTSIAQPFNLRYTEDPATCFSHIGLLGGFICQAAIEDRYAVLVWEQGGCWPGADCTEDVAGYNVYELTPQGEVLRKSTEHKDQRAVVFAPPSWPEGASVEHCFVVRGYTELGFESPPSNIGCYSFGQLGANPMELYPASYLWRFHRQYEDCGGNYGTGAYYPAAENPPYGTIVAGYEHSTAHCDFWNIAYRGGVWFDVSQIPGPIAYAHLTYDWVGGIYAPGSDVATNELVSCASNLMLGTQDWRGDPYGDQPISIPAADYAPLLGGSPSSGGYSIDVTPAVKAWLDGSAPNYGFVLRGPQENVSGDHGNSRCASKYANFVLQVAYFGQ